jgi:hypothetical protein
MDLAAVGHHEQPRGGHVNSTRAGTAGRAHLVTTCTVNNVYGREEVLKFFAPLLYSLITMVVDLGAHDLLGSIVRSTE